VVVVVVIVVVVVVVVVVVGVVQQHLSHYIDTIDIILCQSTYTYLLENEVHPDRFEMTQP